MKINLKKSASIQQQIISRVGELSVSNPWSDNNIFNVNITAFEKPEDIIDAKVNEVTGKLKRISNLELALLDLRDKTGVANSRVGVTSLLASLNFYNRYLKANTVFKFMEPKKDLLVIKKKLHQIETAEEVKFHSDFSTNIFDQVYIDKMNDLLLDANRQIQQIKEKLLEINYKSKIELSEETVETLETEKIL